VLEVVGAERAWVMRKRQQIRSFFSRRWAHAPSEEPSNRHV
jgi:hypothetical protein